MKTTNEKVYHNLCKPFFDLGKFRPCNNVHVVPWLKQWGIIE
jgi:hypothetical protein